MDSGGTDLLGYFPLDAGAELVREAAGHVAASLPGVAIHPLAAELGAYPELSGWLAGAGRADAARLFSCLGMAPNFDATELAGYLRGLLRPGDGLLLSANLSPRGMAADERAILAQYDNPTARHWYAGALENLGLAGADFALAVSARALAVDGGSWQIVVEAELLKPAALRYAGAEIAYKKGERLEVFFSNRFTREAFAAVLSWAKLEAAT